MSCSTSMLPAFLLALKWWADERRRLRLPYHPASMTTHPAKVQIYVRLLDEGTEVWRPVPATQVGDAYLLDGPVTDGDVLEFPVGTLVRCGHRQFMGTQQTQLIAVEAAGQWGDSVMVKPGARPEWRPGAGAAVCGVRQVESVEVATAFGAAVGTQLILIEFSDGSSTEVPEAVLEREDLGGNEVQGRRQE